MIFDTLYDISIRSWTPKRRMDKIMSTLIYTEFASRGNAPDARPREFKPFAIKPTPESRHRELSKIKYEGRRNRCGSCFMARSATGECGC